MAEISPKLIKELVDNIKNLKKNVDIIGKDVNSIDDVISEKLTDPMGSFDPDNLRDSIIKGIKKSGLSEDEFPVDEMVDKISNKFIATTNNTIDEVFSEGSKRIIKEILASNKVPRDIDLLDKKSLEKILSDIKSDNNINEITFDIGEVAPANDNSLVNSGNILINEDLPDVVNLDDPKEPLIEEEIPTDNLADLDKLSENIIDSIKELTEIREPVINKDPIDFIHNTVKHTEPEDDFISLTNEQNKILAENEIDTIENIIDSSIVKSNKKEDEDKIINPDVVISLDDIITNTKTEIENADSYNKEELVDKVDAVIDSTKTIEDKLEFSAPAPIVKKEESDVGDTINTVNDILNEFTEVKRLPDDNKINNNETIDTLSKEHEEILVKNDLPKLKEVTERNKEQDEVLNSNLELSNRIESLIATIEATNIANMKENKEQRYSEDKTTIKGKKERKKESSVPEETKEYKKTNEYSAASIKLLEDIVGLLSGPLKISDTRPNRPDSRFN